MGSAQGSMSTTTPIVSRSRKFTEQVRVPPSAFFFVSQLQKLGRSGEMTAQTDVAPTGATRFAWPKRPKKPRTQRAMLLLCMRSFVLLGALPRCI